MEDQHQIRLGGGSITAGAGAWAAVGIIGLAAL
jgi:hypothetical protein